MCARCVCVCVTQCVRVYVCVVSETTIKIQFCGFERGALGAERTIIQNAVFLGQCHDNTILKVPPAPKYHIKGCSHSSFDM